MMRVMYLGANGVGVQNATGQTLRQLYKGLGEDDFLEVSYGKRGIWKNGSGVSIPEALAPVDVLLRLPMRLARMLRLKRADDVPHGLNDAVRVDGLSLKRRFRRDARAVADCSPLHLTPRFLRRIRSFDPQVIHTILGNVRQMKLAVALSEELSIPIVPHFMDDWPELLYSNGEVFGLARLAVRRALSEVIDRSPVLLCVGELMAEEYAHRFNRITSVARFGVDADGVSEVGRVAQEGPRRLVYAGGLHLGRDLVVQAIATGLAETGWVLEVYGGGVRDCSIPALKLMPEVPVEDLADLLHGADALLFVESFDGAIAKYTRLSVSTKVAQYVAAKRPTVIVGPTGQASVELLSRTIVASFRVSSIDPAEISGLMDFLDQTPSADGGTFALPAEFKRSVMHQNMMTAFQEAQRGWTQLDSRLVRR